jgi:hypothetical protein
MRKGPLLAVLVVALLAPATAGAQDWRNLSQSRARSAEKALRVNVEYGAGLLELRPAQTGILYRARMRYDAEAFTPELEYQDGRLDIEIQGGHVRGRNMKGGNLDLALGTEVPIDLNLQFGAAEARMELGGMRLSRASIKTGASKTVINVSSPNPQVCRSLEIEVGAAQLEANSLGNLHLEQLKLSGGVGEVLLDFTGAWETDLKADIEMGLGSLTLRVPRGLGIRVRKQGILAGFDSQGLVKRGDVYFSENWDKAERRLTIELEAALGSIRVVWVDS